MVSHDLPHGLLKVFHVEVADGYLCKIDLVGGEGQGESLHVARLRLVLGTLHSDVAERINLALNRLLKAYTELEHASHGFILLLATSIVELGGDEDRMERLQVV